MGNEILEELNNSQEKFEGEKLIVTMKKPSTKYEHGEEVFELFNNLAGGMTMPNTILAKLDGKDGKVVCFDSKIASDTAIGFITGMKKEDGTEVERKKVPDYVGKRTLKGKILKGDYNSRSFELEMYLEEEVLVSGGQVVESDAIQKEIERIVNEGIRSQESCERAIKIMRNNRIGDGRILAVLKQHRKYFYNNGESQAPIWEPDAEYVDANPELPRSIFGRAIKAALAGHALVFEGDKSVGKNVCGECVAYCLGMPYFWMGFDAYMTSETVYGESATDNSAGEKLDLEGAGAYLKYMFDKENMTEEEKALADSFELNKAKAATVQIVKNYSQLVIWARTGGVMMFNEYNMGDANLKQQFMNPMLDSTHQINVPGLGPITLNDDCVLICSANPGFVGEMAENAATRSRLGTIKFPNASQIIKQLKASLGESYVPEKYFNACNDYYMAIKGMVGTISDQCLNIRGFKRALEGVKQDINDGEEPSLADDIILQVIDGCPEEDIPNLKLQLNEIVEI